MQGIDRLTSGRYDRVQAQGPWRCGELIDGNLPQDLIATDGVGTQIGGMFGHGQQAGLDVQHVADEPDGIQGTDAEIVECQQHQVAEVVTRQLAAPREAIFEQSAADAGFGHQLIQAVAQIAPGDALLALAQASGGAAIIGRGDNARQPSA